MSVFTFFFAASFFFFNDTATTEIYTLSLHDALPISAGDRAAGIGAGRRKCNRGPIPAGCARDTRRRDRHDRRDRVVLERERARTTVAGRVGATPGNGCARRVRAAVGLGQV